MARLRAPARDVVEKPSMLTQTSTTERHRGFGSASLILGTLMAVGTLAPADAAIPTVERDALIALYNSTNGAAWADRTDWRNAGDTDFNDPGTECTWYGVTCDEAGTAVVELDPHGNNLSGTIPPELGNLGSLWAIDLNSNQLSGSIPPELGNLGSLVRLYLYSNQLSGSIPPELGKLGNLERLYLHANQLSGSIPPELGKLGSLEDLYLHSNQLSGSIPPELGKLGSLERLYLYDNQLSGSIPPELGNLSSLGYLVLNRNQLSGSIPPELGNLSSLEDLYLYDNQLSGSIPPELGKLGSLERLFLYDNQLSGSIPPELGKLGSLEFLYLYDNQLSGSIPPDLGALSSLLSLYLHANQLSGSIPPEILNLLSLLDNTSDLRWNALHSDSSAVVAFCNQKQFGGDWQSTQTVAPDDVAVWSVGDHTAWLSWDAVTYTADPGGYEVFFAPTGSGVWRSGGWTGAKTETVFPVTGLDPATPYDFAVATYTSPHSLNQNLVRSDLSSEVMATTANTGCIAPVIEIERGTPIVLSVAGSFDSYLWSTGETTSSVEVDPALALWYWVTVTSAGPCEETSAVSPTLTEVTVPVAAHLAGVGGTPWRSDLAFTNPEDGQMSVRLTYQPGPDTLMSRSFALAAHGTLLCEDVVQSVFEAGDGRGPIRLEAFSKAAGEPAVLSRIFAERDFGNFGQGMPAVSVMGTGSFYLPGLRQDDVFRSNVAVTASPQSDVTATFELFRGDEGLVAGAAQKNVSAGEQDQWSVNVLFTGMSRPGVPMTVKVTLSAPAVTYASLVDQISTDAVTYLGKIPAAGWIVPVVAHNPGKEETFWSSTVSMANFGAEPATVQLEYLPEKTDNSAGGLTAPDFEVAPGETLDLEDPVLQLFGVEDGKGVLIVESSAPIVLVSRVFTAADVGGTTGHGVRTVSFDALEQRQIVLPGVRMLDDFRTNVGVVTGDHRTAFHFRLRNHNGVQISEKFITVPPRTVRQWSIQALFGKNVRVVDPTGSVAVDADGEFFAYLVVVDGSSQDPAFMLPLP